VKRAASSIKDPPSSLLRSLTHTPEFVLKPEGKLHGKQKRGESPIKDLILDVHGRLA
jgi:hypothetical protein